MGDVILFNLMSLDGYFEDAKGSLAWHNVDDEFQDFALEQLGQVGALLFGRVTFQFMADFWTSAEALSSDPVTARYMNELPKAVFTKSLTEPGWGNSRILREATPAAIRALKEEYQGPLYIFGSAVLAGSLDSLGLIDEYRVLLNPVILGGGRPLFEGMRVERKLKLEGSRAFRNGNMLLRYRPLP